MFIVYGIFLSDHLLHINNINFRSKETEKHKERIVLVYLNLFRILQSLIKKLNTLTYDGESSNNDVASTPSTISLKDLVKSVLEGGSKLDINKEFSGVGENFCVPEDIPYMNQRMKTLAAAAQWEMYFSPDGRPYFYHKPSQTSTFSYPVAWYDLGISNSYKEARIREVSKDLNGLDKTGDPEKDPKSKDHFLHLKGENHNFEEIQRVNHLEPKDVLEEIKDWSI